MEERLTLLESQIEILQELIEVQTDYIKAIKDDHQNKINTLSNNIVSFSDTFIEFVKGSQKNISELTKILIEIKGGEIKLDQIKPKVSLEIVKD